MNYRIATIWPRRAYTADAVEIIELKVRDPISRLVITDEATNGADAGQQGHPARCITKIELVDGSDVLFSMDGRAAQGLDFYHNKRESGSLVIYPNDMNSEMIYNLNFGRALYDPLLALDPSKFTNLQLKITLDEDGGGKNVDGHYLTVMAHCFDERVISPVGLLAAQELKSYTMVASGHEYTDLPTDRVIRKLLVRSHAYGSGPDYQFESIKLQSDGGKKVYLDNTIGEILRAIVAQYPKYREWVICDPPTAGSSMYTYITPGYWPIAQGQEWLTPPSANNIIGCFSGDGGRLTIGTASGWTSNVSILVEGQCPHNVLDIPMGDQNDPDDWFDASRVGSLELDVKGHASLTAGTCELYVQQLRRY